MEVKQSTWMIHALVALIAYCLLLVTHKLADDTQVFTASSSSGSSSGEVNASSSSEEVSASEESVTCAVIWSPMGTEVKVISLTWIGVILIYSLSLLCRRSGDDSEQYLFHSPPFWNPWMFVFFTIAFLCNIGYVVSAEFSQMILSFVFIFATLWSTFAVLVFAIISLHRTQIDLINRGFQKDVVFNIAVVHNGIGFYCTWALITALQCFTGVLGCYTDLSIFLLTTIAYALLALDFFVYFCVDNAAFRNASRFLFSPYALLLWFLLDAIIEDWSADGNGIFALVLKCVVLVGTFIKVILSIKSSTAACGQEKGYQRI